jgi:hypothetical protein
MTKTTLASMLSYEERKVMHGIAKGKDIQKEKENVIQAQKNRRSIITGMVGEKADNFLKTNTAKKPIKVKEKNKTQNVDKVEEV